MAAVIVLAFAAFGCSNAVGDNLTGPARDTVVIQVNTPTPTAAATPSPTPTTTPLAKVCSTNPDPAKPSEIQVQEPEPEDRVGPIFHVRGWGSRIERDSVGVEVALVDSRLKVVNQGGVPTHAPPQPRAGRIPPRGLEITRFTAPFAVDLYLGVTQPMPICIWVFQQEPGTGDPINVVQVPVLVAPPE
ncbi:MAG: hypothetical protein HYS09_00720 [Chloroflexi bacterium]|nr:hypothetical protein [Chloroflexota bacterium]